MNRNLRLGGDIYGLCDKGGNPTKLAFKIVEAHPHILNVGVWTCAYDSYKWAVKNLHPKLVDFFLKNNVQLLLHVCNTGDLGIWDTPFEQRAKPMLKRILDAVPEAIGVMDGEVHNGEPAKPNHKGRMKFFTDYYNYIKSRTRPDGSEYMLWINTGTKYTFERMMPICDVLSVEWSQGTPELFFEKAPDEYGRKNGEWTKKYPKSRFACTALAYRWEGTVSDAVERIERLWDYFGSVSINYSKWTGWGGVHPFPLRYGDMWIDIMKRLQNDSYKLEQIMDAANNRFGAKRGSVRYCSACDVNDDGIIDMRDIGYMAKHVEE